MSDKWVVKQALGSIELEQILNELDRQYYRIEQILPNKTTGLSYLVVGRKPD